MTERGLKAIRVLIVDDNRLTVENVERLLNFERGIEVVGSARDGRAGIEQAQALCPDVILMDINMPDIDGIEACRQISQLVPGCRVMMMSVQSDMEYLKGAMHAGAREFLIKPFDYDELISAVRRVYNAETTSMERLGRTRSAGQAQPVTIIEQVPPVKMDRGIVVAVFSPKGGGGGSTVAANLAITLCGSRKADVVLVDGDLVFGDLDALLDLRPVHRIVDVIQRYDPDDPELIGQMLASHPSGVRLLAGPARPEQAEMVSGQDFLELLEAISQTHDYVVIDLGSRYRQLVGRVLDLADRAVIVAKPEITAIKDVNLFFMLPEMRSCPPEKVLLLVNHYDPVWGITPEIIADTIGRQVALVVPMDKGAAAAADNLGRPVILSSPRSPMARSLLGLEKLVPDSGQRALELAEAVRQRNSGPPPSIFSRPTPRTIRDQVVSESVPSERRGCKRWIPFLGKR